MITPLNIIEWGLIGFAIAAIASLTLFRNPRLWNLVTHSICIASSSLTLAGAVWAFATGKTFAIYVRLAPHVFPKSVLYLDPLSSFIIAVISLVSLYASIFALGYVDEYFEKPGRLASIGLNYALFIASMVLVALAGDIILFLIAWEVMSITSFFLVLTEHERPDVRRAAFIYLVFTSVSAALITLGFGIGYAYTHSIVFLNWVHGSIPRIAASVMFVILFIGFACKAGIVPLHSWLPQAHPAAPSHVSALLSGVMVKVAIYALIRFSLWVLAPWVCWWWGAIVIAFAALSTFYGVAFALIQHDIKKLLAYHTIENIGIIALGIGVALSAYAANLRPLAVLGLVAALFHTLNHALFKSQLFLCSGSILHQVHTRNLEEMGGLIRRLRATAIAFLIAALGISGMPFFNGFASELLTYLSLLQSFASRAIDVASRLLSMIGVISLSAAGVLAVYCFTKVFGVAFLSYPRSKEAEEAPPEPRSMKASYVIPSALIVGLGLLPTIIAIPLATRLSSMLGASSPLANTWLGLAVSLWSKPSVYVPLLLAGFATVTGFIAWARSIAKTVEARKTIPFVSGVEFSKSFAPTATLYAGNALSSLSSLYGVKRVYKHVYAVKFWTSKAAIVESLPMDFAIKALRALGMSDEEIARAIESSDDLLQVAIYALGRSIVAKGSELAKSIDKRINGALRAIAKGVEKAASAITIIDSKEWNAARAIAKGVEKAASAITIIDSKEWNAARAIAKGVEKAASGVKRIQLGSLYIYLVYIYIALILILIYYFVVR